LEKYVLAWLSEATIVFRIDGRENIAERIGLDAELDKKGRQQAACILLCSVPEVKIEKRDCG
jgi:hypothetical protein